MAVNSAGVDGGNDSHPLIDYPGRIAEPQEVADAIVWLATNRSSYVTGVALPVDGGYPAR